MIEQTDVSQLQPTWRARGENKDNSLGRVGTGADWVYYDPQDRRIIGEEDVKKISARESAPIPEGHPIGFNFDASPGGWVDTATAGAVEEDDERGCSGGDGGWDNDEAAMDEVEPSRYTYGGSPAAYGAIPRGFVPVYDEVVP